MKQNNTLLIIIAIIAVFVIINNKNIFSGSTIPLVSGHNICYQETANVSTSCGGLNTGKYAFMGNIEYTSKLFDGNWDTFSGTSGSPEGYIYINYTKITNSLSSSLWQTRDFCQIIGNNQLNISLNSACWNAYSNKLSFKVTSNILSVFDLGGGNNEMRGNVTWSCWDGTGWQTIRQSPNCFYGSNIAEEAMWWDIGSTSTCNNVADTSSDCVISNTELLSYINLWKAGTATRDNLGIAIDIWINGGY